MLTGKWSVSPAGILTHPGTPATKPVRIIHVEDHSLFSTAVKDYCIKPFFDNAEVIQFKNADTAFAFIKEELRNNKKIDLIITDINHPGMRGQELIRCIRHVERLCKRIIRIPIIVLTMMEEHNCPELMTEKMISYYLSKCMQAEEIVEALEEVLLTPLPLRR